MGKLINHHKAKEYLDSLSDPIVQALIQYAYGNIWVEDLTDELEGEFDVLLLYKILAALLRDREKLAKALTGELQQTFGKDCPPSCPETMASPVAFRDPEARI